MISAARFPYLSIRAAAARARSRFGGSCPSHSRQLLALVMAAAMGCLISCASEAAISPNVLTRLVCARSASSCRSFFTLLRIGDLSLVETVGASLIVLTHQARYVSCCFQGSRCRLFRFAGLLSAASHTPP